MGERDKRVGNQADEGEKERREEMGEVGKWREYVGGKVVLVRFFCCC